MFTGQSTYDLMQIEDTGGMMTGWVYKTKEELAEKDMVGFFVPKLFGLMQSDSGPKEKDVTIKENIFANDAKWKPNVAGSVKTINWLKVKYNGRSNFTQPVIALGETAYIFFVDGDYKHPRYTDDNNNEKKRKTDHIELFCFGKQEVDTDPGDAYKIGISTRDKKIFIHTSQNNGESHMYDIIIDTDAGTVVTQDETGNAYGFETDAKHVWMKNADASIVELTEKNAHIKVDEKIHVECNDLQVDAKTSVIIEAGTKYELHATKIKETGDATINMVTATMTCDVSAMFKCTAPMSLFSGIVGASGLGISPAPQSPPSIQMINASGAFYLH